MWRPGSDVPRDTSSAPLLTGRIDAAAPPSVAAAPRAAPKKLSSQTSALSFMTRKVEASEGARLDREAEAERKQAEWVLDTRVKQAKAGVRRGIVCVRDHRSNFGCRGVGAGRGGGVGGGGGGAAGSTAKSGRSSYGSFNTGVDTLNDVLLRVNNMLAPLDDALHEADCACCRYVGVLQVEAPHESSGSNFAARGIGGAGLGAAQAAANEAAAAPRHQFINESRQGALVCPRVLCLDVHADCCPHAAKVGAEVRARHRIEVGHDVDHA